MTRPHTAHLAAATLIDLELGLPRCIEVREIWVLQSVLATDPLVGLVRQESRKEVNTMGIEARHNRGHFLWEHKVSRTHDQRNRRVLAGALGDQAGKVGFQSGSLETPGQMASVGVPQTRKMR